MNEKEKIIKEKILNEEWSEIAEQKNKLERLINLPSLTKIEDYDILIKCVSIILNHVEIHKNEILKFQEVDKENIENRGDVEKFFYQFGKGIESFIIIFDESQPYQIRLDAINNLRRLAWGSISEHICQIKNMYNRFPDFSGTEDTILVLKCVCLVVTELNMKNEEIKIIEELYKE